MQKRIFSVEQMQPHQEHFHACQDIPFSFPIFYPALFTSFFYAMANAVWRSLCFLQQDSKPTPGPETVKVLHQSLYMQPGFLLPAEAGTYMRNTPL